MKQKFLRNLVAVICVMALGITLTACYFEGAGDVLSEQIQPAETDLPVAEVGVEKVDKTDSIAEEIITFEGFEVTLREVVAYENELRFFIDVEDLSGSPLALYNDDGTLSEWDLQFGKIKLRTEETRDYIDPYWEKRTSGEIYNNDIVLTTPSYVEGGIYIYPIHTIPDHYTRVETIKSDAPNQVTLVLVLTLDEESIDDFTGQNLYLTLTDITQKVMRDGVDTGADLYAIVSEFNDVTDADFRIGGRSGTRPDYELIGDGGKEILLSDNPDYSDYTVTNAALRDGILYLRGEVKNYADNNDNYNQSNRPSFALRNVSTGEVFFGLRGSQDSDRDRVLRWNFSSGDLGINSLEDLKNYVFVDGYGARGETLVLGEWGGEFEF